MQIRRLWLVSAAAAVAVVCGIGAASTRADSPLVALGAQVVYVDKPSNIYSYPTQDYTTNRAGKTSWRVVNQTGNCCENFLTTNAQGRLFDFGGSYINYTDDRGLTWRQVRPLEPLQNGEGAIAVAPNGDVLGVQWDPYTGDHLLSFKYEADGDRWLYNELPLHVPFYDREWIAVVPGPITLEGDTVPYISIIKGAWPSKELWLVSTDGVNYFEASSKFVDSTLNSARQGWIVTKPNPGFDWLAPNTSTGITPLGDGAALAAPDYPFDDEQWALLDRGDREWHGFRFGDGSAPVGRYLVDSAGRLHNVVQDGSTFTYRISKDGGQSWRSTQLAVPAGLDAVEWDFRANKAVGVAALVVQAQDPNTTVSRYLAYRLDIRKDTPALRRRYEIGLGDVGAESGVTASGARFDFNTVAIFPDGRLAVTFIDSTTIVPSATNPSRNGPAVAIEQTTTFK